MNKGYIKLHRKILDSLVFEHEGIFKLWCLCLLLANHKEEEVKAPYSLKVIKLKPGQFLTGRDSLHRAYHQSQIRKKYSRRARPTAITLYRWLLFLQKCQNLNIKTYNKYSIITITNWSQYQVNEQQMNNRRTTDEHKQECIKKKEKEIYKEKERGCLSFFEKFYLEYPKKKSRGQAEKAWKALKVTESMYKEIMEGLQRACESNEWTKNNGQYIPYPATWLRGKGWLDEYKERPSWN